MAKKYKYIKRVKTKSGKWRYIYENPGTDKPGFPVINQSFSRPDLNNEDPSKTLSGKIKKYIEEDKKKPHVAPPPNIDPNYTYNASGVSQAVGKGIAKGAKAAHKVAKDTYKEAEHKIYVKNHSRKGKKYSSDAPSKRGSSSKSSNRGNSAKATRRGKGKLTYNKRGGLLYKQGKRGGSSR